MGKATYGWGQGQGKAALVTSLWYPLLPSFLTWNMGMEGGKAAFAAQLTLEASAEAGAGCREAFPQGKITTQGTSGDRGLGFNTNISIWGQGSC